MYAFTCSVATLKIVTDIEVAMTRLVAQINIYLKLSDVKAFKELAFFDDSMSKYDSSIKSGVLRHTRREGRLAGNF
jgi:hypothetical protein